MTVCTHKTRNRSGSASDGTGGGRQDVLPFIPRVCPHRNHHAKGRTGGDRWRCAITIRKKKGEVAHHHVNHKERQRRAHSLAQSCTFQSRATRNENVGGSDARARSANDAPLTPERGVPSSAGP